ncbi:MAG: DNA modification methylase [Spirochaetaceae bacterium]|nr:MAG: DNA modification methylase [Spirochaetaceae bacterium]
MNDTTPTETTNAQAQRCESPAFLRDQLITYLGNKRALLGFIGEAVAVVKERLGKSHLRVLDLFAGSGVVSRFLKQHAELLICNDFERYAEVINRCYLSNASERNLPELQEAHARITAQLRNAELNPGIIAKHYAPLDDTNIQPGERVFYTTRNAAYLDTARGLIETLPEEIRQYFLGPLLAEASVHANTSGVFKGFYKDARTGIGRFGGSNSDALSRITADIELPFPVWSAFDCQVDVRRQDAVAAARDIDSEHGRLDLAYLDPPYNQHPYGSNYFLLNVLVSNRAPSSMSTVSGIPTDWQRSAFNQRRGAMKAFRQVVEALDTQFLLVSFNSEGFISREDMVGYLSSIGSLEVLESRYNTFRGSRNLRGRNIHLTEYLYLVEMT